MNEEAVSDEELQRLQNRRAGGRGEGCDEAATAYVVQCPAHVPAQNVTKTLRARGVMWRVYSAAAEAGPVDGTRKATSSLLLLLLLLSVMK